MAHAVLVQQQRACPRHGDQNIAASHLLQLPRAFDNFLVSCQLLAKNIAEFKIIGLYQEGMVFKNIDQEILLRVHSDPDPAAVEARHQFLVGVTGQAGRNRT